MPNTKFKEIRIKEVKKQETMKKIILIIFMLNTFFLIAQEQESDSTQYNIGYTIGENIPVVLLMALAIFFIYKSYRKRNDDTKTDFMNDGTKEV